MLDVLMIVPERKEERVVRVRSWVVGAVDGGGGGW